MTGRDGNDSVENDLISKTLESLRRAKEHSDKQKQVGEDIMALEEDMKANGSELLSPLSAFVY